MRKLNLFLLCTLLSGGVFAMEAGFAAIHHDNAISIDHQIVRATTFSNSARITRRSSMSMKKGQHWYRLSSLPKDLDPGSFRIETRGVTGSKIEQVVVERQVEKTVHRPEFKEILSEMRGIYGSLLELHQQRYLLQNQRSYLSSISLAAPFDRSNSGQYQRFSASMKTLSSALTMLRTEQDGLNKQVQSLDQKTKDLVNRVNTLHQRADQFVNTSNQTEVFHFYVLVDSRESGRGGLNFEYVIPNANWKPIYDLRTRLDRRKGVASIELVYSGLVQQRTGEDWKGIELTVSTSDPTPLILPQLNHWKLSEQRVAAPQKRSRSMFSGGAKESMVAVADQRADFAASAPATQSKLMKGALAKREKEIQGISMDEDFMDMKAEEVAKETQVSHRRSENQARMQAKRARSGKSRESILHPGAGSSIPGLINEGVIYNFVPLALSNIFPNYGRLISSVGQAEKRVYAANPVNIGQQAQSFVSQASDSPSRIANGRKIEMQSPLRVNLPSHPEAQKIPLLVKKISGDLSYFAIPKKDGRVFLRTKAKNSTEMPILRGRANVYMDGSLVSKTDLPTVSENGHFYINLGVDQNVETKRKVSKAAKDKGLLFKKHQTEVTVDLEVLNRHGFPISLELKDQLPISPTDKIEVKLEKITPESKENRNGILSWALNVPPGKKKKVSFTYLVTHPSNYILSEFN